MARVDENHERLKKNRWLRALQLARILFDDEGYFTYYLDQIEEFVKHHHLQTSGAAFEIRNKEVIEVSDRNCGNCQDCRTFTAKDAALLAIDLTTGHLSYSLDIGKPFPFHHASVVVCIEKGQIICRIQRPADEHDITN